MCSNQVKPHNQHTCGYWAWAYYWIGPLAQLTFKFSLSQRSAEVFSHWNTSLDTDRIDHFLSRFAAKGVSAIPETSCSTAGDWHISQRSSRANRSDGSDENCCAFPTKIAKPEWVFNWEWLALVRCAEQTSRQANSVGAVLFTVGNLCSSPP